MSTQRPVVFLVDNGSLVPEATLSLRRIAAAVSAAVGVPVEPVSLLHSSGVPAARLGGTPAEILEPAVSRRAAEGAREFLVLPLFFGPTRALSSYLPERAAHLAAKFPGLSVRCAPWLVRLPGDGSDTLAGATPLTAEGDGAAEVLDILCDQIRASRPDCEPCSIALVDHGSPEPRVTRVRNHLAAALCRRLRPDPAVLEVRPCSMERREGDAYLFNEPLLEHLLASPGYDTGTVVVSMLFLQPGRHAGPGGDIATICANAESTHPRLRSVRTPLVGEHPALIPLLARRLTQALASC